MFGNDEPNGLFTLNAPTQTRLSLGRMNINSSVPAQPRRSAWYFLLLLAAGAWLGLGASAATAPAKPNILFAVADDWSYGHAGAYGCRWIKTPAFDRVAWPPRSRST